MAAGILAGGGEGVQRRLPKSCRTRIEPALGRRGGGGRSGRLTWDGGSLGNRDWTGKLAGTMPTCARHCAVAKLPSFCLPRAEPSQSSATVNLQPNYVSSILISEKVPTNRVSLIQACPGFRLPPIRQRCSAAGTQLGGGCALQNLALGY